MYMLEGDYAYGIQHMISSHVIVHYLVMIISTINKISSQKLQ